PSAIVSPPTTASVPPACGSPLISSRIVGGSNATDGEWPWQISSGFKGSHICGGSVISNRWILTAAHCFENSWSPSDYEVQLGAYQLFQTSPNEIISSVERIIVNSEYVHPSNGADIALLNLTSPITYTKYILPICLPSTSDSFNEGMECWVTGWGTTVYEAKPHTLQEVMTPLISRASCNQMYHLDSQTSASIEISPSDQICAGFAAGQKDSCQGDSGGPLVCKLQGIWYQIRIVSWGEGCADKNRPGVYTLVPAYQSWLSLYSATENTIKVDSFNTENSVPTTATTTQKTTTSSSSYLSNSALLFGAGFLLCIWNIVMTKD
ncbi:serine protease 27-like, partial [Xenopus laevis]|uniref:Serine protease 27-like n=1 Tax=Xenopus laevis TaxID=8355 RepID=A0A8J1LX24_XENLA